MKTTGLNIFAGGSLGLLIGILAGMAVSPVVGSLLGTLASAGVAFLTLHKSGDAPANLMRIGFFALFCVVGALAGVFIRANNLLGLTPDRYVSQLVAAGMSRKDAIAFYEQTLLQVPPKEPAPSKDLTNSPSPADSSSNGGLFAGTTSEQIALVDMLNKNSNWNVIVANIRSTFPKWTNTTTAIGQATSLSDADKKALLLALVQKP